MKSEFLKHEEKERLEYDKNKPKSNIIIIWREILKIPSETCYYARHDKRKLLFTVVFSMTFIPLCILIFFPIAAFKDLVHIIMYIKNIFKADVEAEVIDRLKKQEEYEIFKEKVEYDKAN